MWLGIIARFRTNKLRPLTGMPAAMSLGLSLALASCGQDTGSQTTSQRDEAAVETANHSADGMPHDRTAGGRDVPLPPPQPENEKEENTVFDGEGHRDSLPGKSNQDPKGAKKSQTPSSTGTCYEAKPLICEIELEVTRLTNELRGSRPDLRYDEQLAFVARDWSAQQAASGHLSHAGFPRARHDVYRGEFPNAEDVSIRAENVALGSVRTPIVATEVASQLVNMWRTSFGHRRNMLGGYSAIGVGVTIKNSRVYANDISLKVLGRI